MTLIVTKICVVFGMSYMLVNRMGKKLQHIYMSNSTLNKYKLIIISNPFNPKNAEWY